MNWISFDDSCKMVFKISLACLRLRCESEERNRICELRYHLFIVVFITSINIRDNKNETLDIQFEFISKKIDIEWQETYKYHFIPIQIIWFYARLIFLHRNCNYLDGSYESGNESNFKTNKLQFGKRGNIFGLFK